MKNNNCNCCRCCNYEFDTLALYPNFNDGSVVDTRYLLDTWRFDNHIELRNVTLVYRYMNLFQAQHYGISYHYENWKWLEELGYKRYNFFRDYFHQTEEYTNMFNYVVNHKSLVIFLGKTDKYTEVEMDAYKQLRCIPVYQLLEEEYKEIVWPGSPDLDILSYKYNKN